MLFLQPQSLEDALSLKSEHPTARFIAGGTDLMVELNFDRARPDALIDLSHVAELGECGRDNGTVRFGANVPYTRLIAELAAELPGLAIAARTVGSPQIRNRGTVGGNLGTASPAGDALPPLAAAGAEVQVRSVRGARTIPAAQFVLRPKVSALEPDELIVAVDMPVARGPQQFSKIGGRNAMVIAVASFALSIDPVQRAVGTGIGSAGPTIIEASDAERQLEQDLTASGQWDAPTALDRDVVARFAELVSQAARPIDDLRGTAAYRRHALSVLARRALTWAWNDYRRSA